MNSDMGGDLSEYLRRNTIYQGDAIKLLDLVEPGSVALSFWSPPYFVGKPYEIDLDFIAWKNLLETAIFKHFPIIKPGGFLVINIADILVFRDEFMPRIQAANVTRLRSPITREDVLRAQREHPNYNRNELAELLGCSEQTVDRRLHGNNIRGGKYNTQTRVLLVGGLIQEWAQRAGFYLYDRRIWVKDPAWASCNWHTLSYRAIDESEYLFVFWKPGITTIDRKKLSKQEWSEWGSRGVWHIRSVRSNNDHPAKFPLKLARRVIKLFSAVEDLVLDPFIGSGVTAVAAIEEGRNYLGIDLMAEYVELAKTNCKKAYDKLQAYPLLLDVGKVEH